MLKMPTNLAAVIRLMIDAQCTLLDMILQDYKECSDLIENSSILTEEFQILNNRIACCKEYYKDLDSKSDEALMRMFRQSSALGMIESASSSSCADKTNL